MTSKHQTFHWLGVLLFVITLAGSASHGQAGPWHDQPVSVEVHRDTSAVDSYTGIPWSLRMTALDAMKMADGLKFSAEWNRTLGSWFITSIAGIPSQGSGKNWLFCVNGSAAGVGAGSFTLGPGAKVVWTYEASYPPKNC